MKLREHLNTHSFLINLPITLLGVVLYAYAFLAEARTPLALFYDAFLPQMASEDGLDRVSGSGALVRP